MNKNISKINTGFKSKLISVSLAATIMLGTLTAPIKANFGISDALGKASNTCGRFITSKFGVKAIASCLLITQNIMQYYADQKTPSTDVPKKDQSASIHKKTDQKDVKFYLGATAGVLSAGADGKSLDIANAGVNLIFGINLIDKLYDIGDKFLVQNYKKWEKKSPFLKKLNTHLITPVRSFLFDDSKLFQQIISKLQGLSSTKIWKFLTSKCGAKTLCELLKIANGSLAFYNEENNIKSGSTKALPFYIGTSAGLMSKLAGQKFYDSIKAIVKLCIGEKLSKQAKQIVTLKLPTSAGKIVSEKVADIIF